MGYWEFLERRERREMGGGVVWLSWGFGVFGLGGWMLRRVEWGGRELGCGFLFFRFS